MLKENISLAMWAFLRSLANWMIPTKYENCTTMNLNFFSLKYSKFPVECEWNSEISQITTKFFFGGGRWLITKERIFSEKFGFFSKSLKLVNFRRLRIKWYYFLKMSFPYLNWGNQKILKFGKIKKKVY